MTRNSNWSPTCAAINDSIRGSGFLLVFVPDKYAGAGKRHFAIIAVSSGMRRVFKRIKYSKVRKMLNDGTLLEFVETECAVYRMNNG